MKKIYIILFALLSMSTMFTSCSEEEPFSVASSSDDPRILDPIFPNRVNGELPVVANINRDANLNMKLTVTPADFTEVTWFIDGVEVAKGKTIDMNLKAGKYLFKVVATTVEGKSTSREGYVQVNALAGDPWATTKSFERIVAPKSQATLYGVNMNLVKSIVIDGKSITDVTFSEDHITYTVPEDVTEGEHRVVLVDAQGNEFGANTVKVTKSALVVSGAERTNANREWVMKGINLDRVVSLTLDGKSITEFTRKSASEIAIICPALADGEYKMTGKMDDGADVLFYNNEEMKSEQNVIVSSQTVLWQGHHYVSWDLPDSSPNKTFNLISTATFNTIKAGSIMRIHYSVNAADAYHQLRTVSGWWNDLPGSAVIEFQNDGVKELIITQDVLNAINEQSGFLCVGHGYYVDMITIE